MSNNTSSSAQQNFGRRQWDVQTYEKKAKERLERELAGVATDEKRKTPVAPTERKPLEARDDKTEELKNLENTLGKKRITVTEETKTSSLGFVCKLCNVSFKDSNSYTDHLNSQQHLHNKGYQTRAVRSTLDDVQSKLAVKKNTSNKESMKPILPPVAKKSETTTSTKDSTEEDKKEEDAEEDMKKLLGFSNFSSSKGKS